MALAHNENFLMPMYLNILNIKHSELEEDKHVYKGRVVFGGNNVRDENGVLAVFQEQGTSASHMVCAKFLDAVARMPGCSGEDADATKAYLQAHLKDFEGNTETWIELPKDQWPKHWHGKYHRPVVRLLRNLYGHPLAGLYWEKHCHRAIVACGFHLLQGWECMYGHKEKGLFLSVYVDDFKMAGKSCNIGPMWKKLQEHLRLDPPTPFHDSTYLGCQQYDSYCTETDLKLQRDYYNQTFADEEYDIKTADQTLLSDVRADQLSKRASKRAAKKAAPTLVADAPIVAPVSSVADAPIEPGDIEEYFRIGDMNFIVFGMAAHPSNKAENVKSYYYSMRGHAENASNVTWNLPTCVKINLR